MRCSRRAQSRARAIAITASARRSSRLVGMTAFRSLRTAGVADAAVVADLLDRFNREYETPTPGPAVLVARLERLLSSGNVVALLGWRAGRRTGAAYPAPQRLVRGPRRSARRAVRRSC